MLRIRETAYEDKPMKRFAATILIGFCLVGTVWAGGRKSQAAPVPDAAREQQFTYYWYAAQQNIQDEQNATALQQLLFCEQLCPTDAQTKEFIGVLYETIGDSKRAFPYLKAAYELDPANHWYYYLVALSKQKTEAANRESLRVIQHATRLNPKDAAAWRNLYLLAALNGKYKEALRAQDQVDALEGYNAESAYNRYRIYIGMQDKRHAIQVLDDYLAKEPYDLHFLLLKVELLTVTNAPVKQQIEALQAVLRVDPGNLTTLNNYAYLLATTGGDLRQAEQMSLQTIREQPENAVFLDTYAWILHLQGQDTLAGFYIRKALQNARTEDKKEIEEHYKVIVK